MASEGYHEPIPEITDKTREMHRALTSLQEELEAIDWYQQRIDATQDHELIKILSHNRDEEKEHAAMLIVWICQHDTTFDKELRSRLLSDNKS